MKEMHSTFIQLMIIKHRSWVGFIESIDFGSYFNNIIFEILKDENDVKCGQTTFMDVTKLIADKIKDEQLTRLAMGSGYQALNRMNTFSEMGKYDRLSWLDY